MILRGVVENHTWTETVSLGWDRSIGPAQPLYELAASSLLSKRKPPLLSPCPDTIRGGRAIKFQGSIEVHALALANRYFNAMKWHKWLFDRGADVCRPTNGIWRFHPFWQNHWDRPRPLARYLLCQILAWLFVLITCLCSAFVSYTTPNVGLGCRSFNHLLYAVLALAAACLRVPTVFVDAAKYPRWVLVARIAHTTVLWINAVVVLVGGSVLQFLGAFKTCWCAAGLLGGPDTLISMGANTLLAQSWARAVWVNMGYLSFGWVVVVALGALAVRLYISYTIRDAVDI